MSPVDPLRKVMGAVNGFQRRVRWTGVPYAVQKKFGDDNANLVVVALAWYGFTAIFPLLLAVVTIFADIGARSLGTGVLDTLHQFPVIGENFNPAIAARLHGQQRSGWSSAWSACCTVRRASPRPRSSRWPRCGTSRGPSAPASCRGSGGSLAGLITIGGAFLINAFASTYATGGTSSYAIRIPVTIGLLVINVLLYFGAFALLTAKVIGRGA